MTGNSFLWNFNLDLSSSLSEREREKSVTNTYFVSLKSSNSEVTIGAPDGRSWFFYSERDFFFSLHVYAGSMARPQYVGFPMWRHNFQTGCYLFEDRLHHNYIQKLSSYLTVKRFSIINTNLLNMYNEVIALCHDNCMKYSTKLYEKCRVS
jgi:hypothetical protein